VAKKTVSTGESLRLHKAKKLTKIGNGLQKLSSMSKHEKRSFKPYRGQGR